MTSFLAFLIPSLVFAAALAWIDRRIARLPLALRILAREERTEGMDGLRQAIATRAGEATGEALARIAAHEAALTRALRIQTAIAEARARQSENKLRELVTLLERAHALHPLLRLPLSELPPSPPAPEVPAEDERVTVPGIQPARAPLASAVLPRAQDEEDDTLDEDREETRVVPRARVHQLLPQAPRGAS